MPSKLFLPSTDESPKILFDPSIGLLEMDGKSLPEDVTGFYFPLENLVIEYAQSPLPVTQINLRFSYLNSASTKKVLEIINKFEPVYQKGLEVNINWFYIENDDDMKDEGEEFARLTDIPINIIMSIE
jgi:hypothetical protein